MMSDYDKTYVIKCEGGYMLYSTTHRRRLCEPMPAEQFRQWYVNHYCGPDASEIVRSSRLAECNQRLDRAERYGTSSHDPALTPEKIMGV